MAVTGVVARTDISPLRRARSAPDRLRGLLHPCFPAVRRGDADAEEGRGPVVDAVLTILCEPAGMGMLRIGFGFELGVDLGDQSPDRVRVFPVDVEETEVCRL
jgi:hypothetical protein